MSKAGAHFSAEALRFLRGLAKHNERAWFDARKPVYEQELKAPMLAIIAEVNAAFADFAPAHLRPPQKAMMRIYRDTRFSREKIPYKTHMAAWWARDGLEKTSGGGYYLQVSAKEVIVAAGCYMPEKEQLLAIRRHLLEQHPQMRRLLADRTLQAVAKPFDAAKLTRAPKGFPADHPAMDLIVCRQWGVSATLPTECALAPGFVREVVKRFHVMAPLVDFLNIPLLPAARPAREPSFGL